jgi:hypothetical protein
MYIFKLVARFQLEKLMLGGRMRALIATALSFTLLACGASQNKRSIDENRSQNANVNTKAEGPFHSLTGWTEKVSFYIDDTAPDTVVEAGIHAAESWNDAMGREVLTFTGVAKMPRGDELYSSLDDTYTMVYFEKKWKNTTGKADTTLATTVWENANGSDRIIKGDVILNAETYHYCDAMDVARNLGEDLDIVDAETVLLHEFGHLLGLDHVDVDDDPESVMHAKTYIGPNMSFRSLSDGDVQNIRQVYE